jgi:hypothetical protein
MSTGQITTLIDPDGKRVVDVLLPPEPSPGCRHFVIAALNVALWMHDTTSVKVKVNKRPATALASHWSAGISTAAGKRRIP